MLQPILVGRGVHRWHPQMEGASLFLIRDLLGNPQEFYNSLLLQVFPPLPFMILAQSIPNQVCSKTGPEDLSRIRRSNAR